MTIADKLVTIAENEQKVFDAGREQGIAYFRATADGSIVNITAKDLEGATEIIDYAFYGCKKLKTLELPEGITRIGTAAFNSCWTVNNDLVIPSTVTTIGAYCFQYCSEITTIICKALTPPTLGAANAIKTGSGLKEIIVPIGCGDAYRWATNWADYADIIVEGDAAGWL